MILCGIFREDTMKNIKVIGILLLCIFMGCNNTEKDKESKKIFSSFLMQYYLDYPLIKSNKDVKRFNEFLRINFQDYKIIRHQVYNLKLDSVAEVLHINVVVDYKKHKSIIDLKMYSDSLDRCAGNNINTGFQSKKLRTIEKYYFLRKIHTLMSTISNDTIGVPIFNKKIPHTKASRVLFLYDNNELSVYCKNNILPKTVTFIEQHLSDFLKNREELPFDYALIPIEVKEKNSL
jgi:hypothetical protein